MYKIGEEAWTQNSSSGMVGTGSFSSFFFFFFFKEANTDSTMLKSRQLAVDFCPQASQSDGAHGDDTTTQILTLCERCK